ncbi:MAG: GAF domain-containing protein [Desulfobacterales bacterium]|nr:GAF domain-containing protein [Desulfobacterales bacterium]
MPTLIVFRNSKDYKVFQFTNVINIGREPGKDIVLDPFPGSKVSRDHADIKQDAEGNYILADSDSMNGTWVGEKKIEQYHLFHGASFRIVNYHFIFVEDSGTENIEEKVFDSQKHSAENNYEQTARMVLAVGKKNGEATEVSRGSEKRLSLILKTISEIVSVLDYKKLTDRVLEISLDIMNAERGFLALKNKNNELVYKVKKGFENGSENLEVSQTIIRKVMEEGGSISTDSDARKDPSESMCAFHLKSVICAPLKVREKVTGCIYLDSHRHIGSFTPDDREILTILAHHIAIAIENARLHKKVQDEKISLKKRLVLKEEIIFESDLMMELYQNIRKIARFNIPVLIVGETGTGKELIARAIHNFSERKGDFIALNCAAIPESLSESELFGHVKGAFTGATSDKAGKFELATGGTIFLDEIGEMSPSLQPKLLRVLHDNNITRVGGSKPIEIDVRVVSATNKDLTDEEVRKQINFRDDLYYRFASKLISHPLRERKEDIKPLAEYFMIKFWEEHNSQPPIISDEAMELLMAYDWPGNINDLKNVVIETSIRTSGVTIYPEDLPERLKKTDKPIFDKFPTLEEVEKKHIQKALELTKGNKKEAAKLLKISRATLYNKARSI